MLTAITVVLNVVSSLLLIVLVLLHSGKGGGLSDMFGGGMGASAMGSTVMERNLDRITVVVALVLIDPATQSDDIGHAARALVAAARAVRDILSGRRHQKAVPGSKPADRRRKSACLLRRFDIPGVADMFRPRSANVRRWLSRRLSSATSGN